MTELPLAGCTIVITRPVDQAIELREAIETAGGRTVCFPVLDIVGRDRQQIASEFATQAQPDLIIFISSNAVRYGAQIGAGATAKIAAIGPTTAATLEKRGMSPDIQPTTGFDSEALLAHPDLQDIAGWSITIVRGTDGRELLAQTLKARGAHVTYLAAYAGQMSEPGEREYAALHDGFSTDSVNYVSIMSVQSLQNFLKLLPRRCLEKLPRSRFVTPSKRVIQTAKEMVPGVSTVLAPGPQSNEVVNALIENWQSGKNQ